MSDGSDTEPGLHPSPGDVPFDLGRAMRGLVAVRSRIPESALTAETLGTERSGNGVVIDDAGIILTIGYLVSDADSVWVITADQRTVPGYVAGYDQASGFGLVRTLEPLGLPALEIGSSASLTIGDPVIAAGWGGSEHAINARVIAKREFAGYWEYVLDEGIFTAPPHPNWGGAGLLAADGSLVGIGSLLVQHTTPAGETGGANLFVPIDLLGPILDDMLRYGRRSGPSRPWLGMLVQDVGDSLVVARVYPNCPADAAGIKPGDVIREVSGQPVDGLARLFRSIWSLGPAGIGVPLTLERDGDALAVNPMSVDRNVLPASPSEGRMH